MAGSQKKQYSNMKTYKVTVIIKSKRRTNALIKFLFQTFAVVSGSLHIEEIETINQDNFNH